MAQHEMVADPAQPAVPTDVGRALGMGTVILVGGFGGFLLWAGLVPLDEGVPAPATIVVESRSSQIQHPTGGVVSEIMVREGQRVLQGEVLLRLSDVGTRAGLDEVRVQWVSMRALEARLLSEQAGLPRVRFPADLAVMSAEPLAQQQMQLQQELFATRRRALNSEMSALAQQRAALQASASGARQSMVARQQQQSLIDQDLAGVRQMVSDGYMARTRQTELERQAAEVRSTVADLQGNITRLQEALSEAAFRLTQRQQEYLKEVESQLSEARREAGAQGERMKAASEGLDRAVIRSPIAGAVVGLAGANAGSVVAPGARLMEIVPDGANLVLEAQIPPNLIDRIKPGHPVDIHLQAFTHLPQLVVGGFVKTVSAASLNDPTTRNSYYLARVELTPDGINQLSGHALQPGMPAEVVVKTGERSLLNYLLRPLLKRFSESMKEA